MQHNDFLKTSLTFRELLIYRSDNLIMRFNMYIFGILKKMKYFNVKFKQFILYIYELKCRKYKYLRRLVI